MKIDNESETIAMADNDDAANDGDGLAVSYQLFHTPQDIVSGYLYCFRLSLPLYRYPEIW